MGKLFGDYHDSTLNGHGNCHKSYYGMTSDKQVVHKSSAPAHESTSVCKSNFKNLHCLAPKLAKKVSEKCTIAESIYLRQSFVTFFFGTTNDLL